MIDRLRETIARIAPLDAPAQEAARQRQDTLTKPRGSLGRLEALSIQIAGITATPTPVINDKAIITMAGDHGVAAEGAIKQRSRAAERRRWRNGHCPS